MVEKATILENRNGIEYTLSTSERAEIRQKYSSVYFPDPSMEPLWHGRRERIRVPDKAAIVDQANLFGPFVLGICSEKYKIIHYEDIVHLIENSVGKITGYGEINIRPHTYQNGGRLQCSIHFPEMKTEIKKLDSIIPKIEVFSSYDLSTKLMGKFGAFQLKCTNGMGIWKSFQKFTKRHLQNLFLNDLGNVISEGLAIYGEQVDQWKLWGETPISEKLYEEVWENLPFSTAERIKIEELPEIGTGRLLSASKNDLDLWSLNSILTQFSTHEVKSEIRRIELEPAIAKVMEHTYLKAA